MQKKTEKWIIPGYPKLGDDLVGQAAVDGQIVYYPKISRSKSDEAILKQVYGVFAVKYFSQPRKLSNGKNVYGFIKLRGCYPDEHQARSFTEAIVREQDSYNVNFIGAVGEWLPLSEESFAKETLNVDEKQEVSKLEQKSDAEKAQERKRILKDLQNREKELLETKDIEEDKESLDYYTMKCVTLRGLDEEERRILNQALPNITEKKRMTKETLEDLDTRHPEFKDMWIANWNKARVKIGIPPYSEPNYMVENQQTTPIPKT